MIRSRVAEPAPANSASILCSVVGSTLRKRVNSRASSALVPTMSGTGWACPVRIASTGSTRQHVVAEGRADRERAQHVDAGGVDQRVERVDQNGRRRRHQRVRRIRPARTEQRVKRSANRAATSCERVNPAAGLSEIA